MVLYIIFLPHQCRLGNKLYEISALFYVELLLLQPDGVDIFFGHVVEFFEAFELSPMLWDDDAFFGTMLVPS